MEIRQLEAFAAVVSLGSFSKAGDRLFLTQPTISAHIGSLEKELGMRLLLRTGKQAIPTEAGRRLYGYALRMLRLREQATLSMRRQSALMREAVSVAASSMPAGCLMPGWMADFCACHADIPFALHRCTGIEVAERVAAGECDLGLTEDTPAHPRCDCRALLEDELVVVTPATAHYRFLGKNGYPPSALLRERVLLPEAGCEARRALEQRLDSAGIQADRLLAVAEIDDPFARCRAVEAGLGIAVLSRRVAEDGVSAGRVSAFSFATGPLRRPIFLITPKHREPSEETALFLEYLYIQEESGRDNLCQT